MAEVSLTKWLDPAFEYFARESGIPIDQYSSQAGGEGIGVALEAVADFFTKGWLNKGIQSVAGLIANGYAIWGKGVPTRLRRELLALGTHELLRFVDPKPSDIIEVRRSVESFVAAVKRSDWNGALASVLRSPAEIQAMLGIVGVPPAVPTSSSSGGRYTVKPPKVTPPVPSPPPVTPPPPKKTPPTPPAVRKGRYQITG